MATPVFILCQDPRHKKLMFYLTKDSFFDSRMRAATDCRLPVKVRGLLYFF